MCTYGATGGKRANGSELIDLLTCRLTYSSPRTEARRGPFKGLLGPETWLSDDDRHIL